MLKIKAKYLFTKVKMQDIIKNMIRSRHIVDIK